MIGKKGVIVPSENAGQAEIDAFHAAIGVPEKPEGYQSLFVKPEQLPDEYWDADYHKEAMTLFKNIGITPKQAAALIAFENEKTLVGIEQNTLSDKAEYDEAVKTNQRLLGKEYDVALHLNNVLISENTQEGEQRDRLLQKFGKDPDFIRYNYEIAKKLKEHNAIKETDMATGLTPAEAKAKAETLRATPGYLDGTMKSDNPAGYDRITKEIEELYKIAIPPKP
jgi:hypothetical protein